MPRDSLTGEVRHHLPARRGDLHRIAAFHDRGRRARGRGRYLRRAYLERGARRHRVSCAPGTAHGQYRLVPHRHRRRFARMAPCRTRAWMPWWWAPRWSTALQILVSRDVSPFEPVVVTVGEFHGGQARNIMAGPRVAHRHGAHVERGPALLKSPIAWSTSSARIAHAFGAHGALHVRAGQRRACQRPRVRRGARARRWSTALGEAGHRRATAGTLSGEDFSEYLRIVPGVFVLRGLPGTPRSGADHPQHSCHYDR